MAIVTLHVPRDDKRLLGRDVGGRVGDHALGHGHIERVAHRRHPREDEVHDSVGGVDLAAWLQRAQAAQVPKLRQLRVPVRRRLCVVLRDGGHNLRLHVDERRAEVGLARLDLLPVDGAALGRVCQQHGGAHAGAVIRRQR
eukprot:365856-Chlamydomonas_euryale.AAC.19